MSIIELGSFRLAALRLAIQNQPDRPHSFALEGWFSLLAFPIETVEKQVHLPDFEII